MLKHTTKPYWLIAATLFPLLAGFDGANAAGYHVFYSFKGTGVGREPIGPLLIDNSGNLTGTALGTVYRLTPDAEEAILYRFPHGSGEQARSGVIADNLGNLYGTTRNGGGTCVYTRQGCGIVFKIAPDGTETTLHVFQGGTDGAYPSGGLVMDGTGNLYGTTQAGGQDCECGTVFKIAPDGTETVLHAFQAFVDGEYPYGGVIPDSSGNLYGTAELGGALGDGTVFKLSPDGTQTVLYSFKGRDSGDGERPSAPLVMDTTGNLYGMTDNGGDAESCDAGCGTVFKLSPDGREKVLHEFHGGADGFTVAFGPGLALDSAGNLYGVADGGSNGGGFVFKISPHGKEKVLHAFESGAADGRDPRSPLTFYNGNLYGTTYAGGAHGAGTVFSLKP